jgi:branched-chain amino acid transport system ATP-binding protein
MTLLQIEDLNVRHGLLHAVRDVTLKIDAGETIALVGANGGGKSTLLRAIAGAGPPPDGRIFLDGDDVTSTEAYGRVKLGISLVPEGRRLFPSLTVEENLMVADDRREGPWNMATVLEAFPILAEVRGRKAGNLSGGEQQATAIGRGLMSNPRVLLLDEVSLGLAPKVVDMLYASLQQVIQTGTTIVLVEQELDRAMSTASRVVCMLEGLVVLEGESRSLARDQVTDAFFSLPSQSGAGR